MFNISQKINRLLNQFYTEAIDTINLNDERYDDYLNFQLAFSSVTIVPLHEILRENAAYSS